MNRPNRNEMNDPCGENRPLNIDLSSKQISSPNFPQNYPNNVNCSWIINTNEPSRIILVFTDFDIEKDKECR